MHANAFGVGRGSVDTRWKFLHKWDPLWAFVTQFWAHWQTDSPIFFSLRCRTCILVAWVKFLSMHGLFTLDSSCLYTPHVRVCVSCPRFGELQVALAQSEGTRPSTSKKSLNKPNMRDMGVWVCFPEGLNFPWFWIISVQIGSYPPVECFFCETIH